MPNPIGSRQLRMPKKLINKPLPNKVVASPLHKLPTSHNVMAPCLGSYLPTSTPPSTPPMVMGIISKTSLLSDDLDVNFEHDPASTLVLLVPPRRWEMDNLEALPAHVLCNIWSMLVTSAAEFRLAFASQGLKNRWQYVLGERHSRKPVRVRAW